MPRGDGGGPVGAGPMTGRRAGYCAGFGVPGFRNPVSGRMIDGRGFGLGRGRGGFGRGMALGYRGGLGYASPGGAGYGAAVPAAVPAELERRNLSDQLSYLEEAVKNIKQRLTELDQDSGDD